MDQVGDYLYPGGELELFGDAKGWKRYCRERLVPFVSGDVLEVGAGIGGSSRSLCSLPGVTSWLALEPDPGLLSQCRSSLEEVCAVPFRVESGTIADIDSGMRFHCLLYLDVLEHIEDDRGELSRARRLLHPGGTLVVLVPAHPSLYSEFDRAIGHHRRYTRASLAAAMPAGLEVRWLGYLDSAGLTASLVNRFLLRRSRPTAKQIRVWDSWMVPVSRRVDRLLGFRVGKSILGVWAATAGGEVSEP